MALCIIWTFITTALDITLNKQQVEIISLKDNIQQIVKDEVHQFETNYKHKVIFLEQQLQEAEEKAKLKGNKIESQNQEMYSLKLKMKEIGELNNQFRDPKGCAEYRKQIQELENTMN